MAEERVATLLVSLAEPKDEPQGQRVAWVRDPFGTLLELATSLYGE